PTCGAANHQHPHARDPFYVASRRRHTRLQWFDGRIAAELRLWDAIDQHRLTPFAYFGIADDLDLREIPFTRGRGYDVDAITNLITANDIWARRVLQHFLEHFGNPPEVR